MSNDPRLEKFHNYKFVAYCADQAEIIGLRAELKAQREMAAIFEQGQQNACEQLDMLREAHRNNINKIMRLGAELDRVTRYANQLEVYAREACAKIAEGEMYAWDTERSYRYNQACRDIADAIRKSART